MILSSWDFRPAVLGKTEAKALLNPRDNVDVWDVFHTGTVSSSEADLALELQELGVLLWTSSRC